MIRANDVFCDVCAKFIRVAKKPEADNPFLKEADGPHFCSHQCAKPYYDNIKSNENRRSA